MDIQIWVFLVIIIVIIALVFVIFQSYTPRIDKWEKEINDVMTECGYLDIPKINVLESNRTYVTGYKDKNNKTTKATIYLCTKDQNGKKYDDNTLITALIHQSTHIIYPKANHDDIIFQNTLQNISLCVSHIRNYDPFLQIDPNYPMDYE